MSKRIIPNDTKYFHYYNANPKNKITCDCVVRALYGVLPNKTYEQIYKELLDVSIKTGHFINSKQCYEKYLSLQGFKKMKQPRKDDGTKYTGRDFCDEIKEYSFNYPDRIFAHIGGHHVVSIIEGRVWDIWDSTYGCIGNYYIKE